MYRYNVRVVEVATRETVLEFEVVRGEFPNEEIAKKYGEMMWGKDSKKYRVEIDSPFTR